MKEDVTNTRIIAINIGEADCIMNVLAVVEILKQGGHIESSAEYDNAMSTLSRKIVQAFFPERLR